MPAKLTNNASSTLLGDIDTDDTTLAIALADATDFPALDEGEWFPLTVVDGVGALEIMRCTARSSNTLTVTRAQEGTTARAFSAGARAEVRPTAAVLAEFVAAVAALGAVGRILVAANESKGVKASPATIDDSGNAAFAAMIASTLRLKANAAAGPELRSIYVLSEADDDYDMSMVFPNGHIAVTWQAGTYTLAALNLEKQVLAGGASVTSKTHGTITSGALTINVDERALHDYTNNGPHELKPGTAHGACYVDITNGATPGATTLTAFNKRVGSLTLTPNAKFRAAISVGPTGSLIQIQEM